MDKKYADATQAFENCRFEDCLRQVDQIFKKLDKADPKKKTQVSQKELNNLNLIKAGSLAATGEIHQAKALLKNHFPHPIISEDMSFLFLQICSMAMDDRIPDFTLKIDEGRDKQNIDINRFLLLNGNFQVLSRIILRQYMLEKKQEDAIAQVYLEYLKQITPHEGISYSRTPIIKELPAANLKMVSMFLNKFIASFNLKENFENKAQQLARHKKIKTSVADLLIKIAIHEANPEAARAHFIEWHQSLGVNKFTHLRSILGMSGQKQQNSLLWTRTYLSIFSSNLNLAKYQPVYDYSIEFIDGFLSENKLGLQNLKEPTRIQKAQMYQYLEDPSVQFQNYYNSLFSEFQLIGEEPENKKEDFYRIAIKNVLLLLLHVSSQAGHQKIAQKALLLSKEHFGKTLTFCTQIHKYTQHGIFPAEFLEQQLKPAHEKWVKAEDQLIWAINQERLFPNNLQANPFDEWQRIVELYERNVNEIEKLRPLEKGERYLSDEFLTVAADSVRKYVETTSQLSEEACEQCFFYILAILEKAVSRSPYNFDLKLRAIYFMEKLGYFEQIIQMLETNDIKAVQFDTLGYFYLKQILNYSLFETNEDLLIRMVRSYQENNRESSEYSYKALKAASINECTENLCYNEHISRSYNLNILLYALYLKNSGKPDSELYLQEILKSLNNPKGNTFNCDFRVMRNVVDWSESDFCDFYGIFTNGQILKNQCLIKTSVCAINAKRPFEDILENLKLIRSDWGLKDLYNFESYSFFERRIKHSSGEGKYHHERQNEIFLKLYNKIVDLKLSLITFSQAIAESRDVKEYTSQSLEKIKEIREYINAHSWRNQTKLIPFTRQHFIEQIGLIVGVNESFLGKTKKNVDGKAEKKGSCTELINSLLASVSEELQLTEVKFEERKWKTESMAQRDELLRRMTSMSSQEFKKIFRIKL